MKRFLSPAFLAIAAICFFLPFVSISCSASGLEGLPGFGEDAESPITGPSPGEGIPGFPGGGDFSGFEVTASGWEIVTAADIQPSGLEGFGDLTGEAGGVTDPTEDFPGRIWAIAAFAIAILGIGLSFIRARLGGVAAVAAGVLGAVFLFLLRSAITGQLGPAGIVGFEVSFEYGYWLSLVAFVIAAIGGVLILLEARSAAAPPPAEPPPPAGEPPPPPG